MGREFGIRPARLGGDLASEPRGWRERFRRSKIGELHLDRLQAEQRAGVYVELRDEPVSEDHPVANLLDGTTGGVRPQRGRVRVAERDLDLGAHQARTGFHGQRGRAVDLAQPHLNCLVDRQIRLPQPRAFGGGEPWWHRLHPVLPFDLVSHRLIMGQQRTHPSVSTSFILTDHAPADVRAAIERTGLVLGPRRTVRVVVLDTFDGRLSAAGLRLELHDGARRELALQSGDDAPPALVAWSGDPPQGVDTLPKGPFGARVADAIEERVLLPVLEVQSSRLEAVRNDRRGRPVLRVVLHEDVRIVASTNPATIPTIVELTGSVGEDTDDDRTLRALHRLGTVRPGDLIDAVLHASGLSLEGHRSSPTVAMRRSDDAQVAFRAVLRNLLSAIDDNLPGTLAEIDTEFLHDLRVAIRRTRSVLAEGKGVLPDDVRATFRAGFGELAAATSRARDLDVYALSWPGMVARLGLDDPDSLTPIHDQLEADRRVAHRDLALALQSESTKELLASWRAWLDADDVPESGAGPIGPHIATRIGKAQAGLLRDARRITPDSPAEDLHDLRKDAKKLRYLLECFGNVLPAKGRKQFVGQLKALQDNLGEHQDAEVQVAELRSIAHALNDAEGIGTDALLAMGRLIDHLERVRERERDAFTERFAAYDTRQNRSLLKSLLAKATRP